MLAKRVIPMLLMRGDQLVKGKQFKSWRSVGVAEQAARIYAKRAVDELVILDIAATPTCNQKGYHKPDFERIRRLTEDNFCPISVGGGVSSVDHVRELLCTGADKVIICTAVCEDRKLLKDVALKFGSQAICVCIDYKHERITKRCGTVMMDSFPWDGVIAQAQGAEECGAGEILLQSIDRDGMMQGYDLEMIRAVTQAVNIPVIAAGGCGNYVHMYEAIQAGADAVAAGSLFLFTDCTPRGAAEYLIERGIECRI